MRILLTALAVYLTLTGLARHATAAEEVAVELSGGTLTGRESGVGLAEVEARVINNSLRPLSAIRIGVFYNNRNEGPPPGVAWIPHEFVLEPPLAPGKSAVLRFSDDEAGEYVLLSVQRVLFGSGLSWNGELAILASPLLERQGAVYIATRDLAELIGAKVEYDGKGDLVSLDRAGNIVKFQVGLSHAFVAGVKTPLERIPFLEGDKSYVPLETFALFFGLKVSYDRALNLVQLSE